MRLGGGGGLNIRNCVQMLRLRDVLFSGFWDMKRMGISQVLFLKNKVKNHRLMVSVCRVLTFDQFKYLWKLLKSEK